MTSNTPSQLQPEVIVRHAPSHRTMKVVAVALAALAAPACEQEGERHVCLKRQYAEYAAVQRDYERMLSRGAVKLDPSLRAVAQVALEEQMAQIDGRQHAFEAQLDTAPGRLRLDQPVNGWLSLPSPPLAELEQRGLAPRSIVSKHPDWPRLEQLLASDRISSLPEFRGPAIRVLTAARETSRCP